MYVYIFTSIVGILLLGYSIKKIYKIKKFIKTTATISGFRRFGHTSDGVRVYPVVQYEVNNTIYNALLTYRKPGYMIGKKITIYYNPDNYEDIDSLESYTFVIIIGIMFLIYPLLTKIL